MGGRPLRRAASKVLCGAESLGLQKLAVRIPQIAKSPATQRDEFQALAEGLYLGAYRFDRHKSPAPDAPKPVEELALLLEGSSRYAAEGIQKADVYSKATILARDLINEPPSRMNPERLADEALKINKPPLSVTVLEKKDLEKLGMGAILGVGAGGAIPPRLVEIVYRPVKKDWQEKLDKKIMEFNYCSQITLTFEDEEQYGISLWDMHPDIEAPMWNKYLPA